VLNLLCAKEVPQVKFLLKMAKFLEKTDCSLNLMVVRQEVAAVFREYPLDGNRRQLNLRLRKENDCDFSDGTGSLWSENESRFVAQEGDFRFFHPRYQGSYLHQLTREVEALHGGPIGRVRLMLLPPRTCYSLHKDPGVRYHLALETNPHSIFVFPDFGVAHIPADGFLYKLDTRLLHTAMNGGTADRLHLVLSAA
jgi:Aspartyl/Asparaginyl beta-hydroxylase